MENRFQSVKVMVRPLLSRKPARRAVVHRLLSLGLLFAGWSWASTALAQTDQGELEARPAPVNLRRCLAGSNAGALCNRDAACPGSSCRPRNIFNPSAALYFNATPAQITAVRNALTAGSAWLFDVTDGQAEFGRVTIINNAPAGVAADFRILPASNDTWWNANTGNWRVGGSVNVSINYIETATTPGPLVAHEFMHLAFDPRDEYESRSAGCGAVTGSDSCPSGASAAGSCLMDGNGSELCIGQATNPPTVGNNHDIDNSTEQSRCRSNRSCWDQVVWSYPNTFLKPAGAPDPNANGATATPPVFTELSGAARLVLVLDQSGSMSLEAPSRMERLQVAAKDFVSLAPNGTEIGLVSFASNVASEVAIAPAGADRSSWLNAIDALTPTTRTNIGAGLSRALTQITTAGGPTGTTFVVLMTDGLNNEPAPPPNAQTSLDASVQALLAQGIPVHVTCTGADLGLSSQCSEIAQGSGGTYVDSATAARLPLSFVEIAARGFGFERIAEWSRARSAALQKIEGLDGSLARSWLGGSLGSGDEAARFFVEKGSRQALFTLQWPNPKQKLSSAVLVSPEGREVRMTTMPQGFYAFVRKPISGVWRIRTAGQVTDPTFRAYSENPLASVAIGVRKANVKPGQPITFYAYPRAGAKALGHPKGVIEAQLTRPDGRQERVVFSDRGRVDQDDVADDGVFTAVYPSTDLRGAYTITALWPIQDWRRAMDAVGHTHKNDPAHPSDHLHGHGRTPWTESVKDYRSPAFLREVSASATVLVKGKDIDREPDDPTPQRR